MDLDLKRRIEALMGHAQGTGPEATIARKRLAALVKSRPDWAWVLDPDAGVPTRQAMDVPSRPHRALLDILAWKHACAIDVEEVAGDPPLGRFVVEGKQGRISALLDEYGRHADRLSLILETVGFAFVRTVLPEETTVEAEAARDAAETAARAAAIEEEERLVREGAAFGISREHLLGPEPAEGDGRFQAFEEARAERLGEAARGLPLTRIGDAAKRMAELATPDKPAPLAGLLSGVSKAWDAPDMTLPEFCGFVRACCPRRTFTDSDLRLRFRAGERFYPPTGRFRLVETLRVPWGEPLLGDEDEPTPRSRRKAPSKRKAKKGTR
jgi:hypothetical protein